MKSSIQRHTLGILFAIIAGVLTSLPTIIPPLLIGDEYQGILFIADNDENTYRARIQEILDGHPWVASPNMYEYKEVPGVVPPINEYLYAIPAFFFGLSTVIMVSKFALPALLFFLAYLLVVQIGSYGHREISWSLKWTGIATGLFVILGVNGIDLNALRPLVSGEGQFGQTLSWTRLVNPIVGALMVFTFLLSLWGALSEGRRSAIALSGVTMALSVGYFFGFGIIACVLFSLWLAFLVKRDYAQLKHISYIFAIGIFCSLPYWIQAVGSMGGAEGKLLAGRNGMLFMHDPIINKFLVAVSIVLLLSFSVGYVLRRNREHGLPWLFLFTVLVGCFIAFNQQIITGRAIWYYHFVQYTVPLGFVIVFLASYFVWRKEFPRLYVAILWLLIVVSTTLLAVISTNIKPQMEEFKARQHHAELFSFLNTRAPKDCVVLIKEESDPIEQMIPAYTHCNVYATTYTFNGVPAERTLHNFLLRMRLDGVTTENMHEYLLQHNYEVRNYFFENWIQVFGSGIDEWLLDKIMIIENSYRPFAHGDLAQQLLTYRIDFLISKQKIEPAIQKELPTLRLIRETSEYYIYDFSPDSHQKG